MKKSYVINVYFEADKIFEREAKGREEALDILNSFDFSNEYLRFTVKDEMFKDVPHFYYNKWSDSIEY